MNELFVNIKVDREERPDIDQIYMAALHHLGEHGGWPLTMFLTPDGEPIWGGTYFPKSARYGKPAFVDVLREIARVFREEPAEDRTNRTALMERLAATTRKAGAVTIGATELDNAAKQLGGIIDPVNGGTRGAPKFPQAALFELLWRGGLRTGEARYFAAVDITLAPHLRGRYLRSSRRRLFPLLGRRALAGAAFREDAVRQRAAPRTSRDRPPARLASRFTAQRARETVAWLEREMTTGEGAFSASLDADSEGEEGKFYVWSYEEVMQATLGTDDGELFARHYDVTPQGNFEGHNILNRLEPLPRSDEDEARLAALRAKLFAVRAPRVRPASTTRCSPTGTA